jgi:putative DNA primase/helicase
MERPETRTFSADPLAMIMSDRGRYIAAALTIVRAFVLAGHPVQPPPLASYEGWTRLVRAPLMWLGAGDPVGTQEYAREHDPEAVAFAATMVELTELIGPGHSAMRAGEVKAAADERRGGSYGEGVAYVRPGLRAALIEVAGHNGDIDPRRLGKYLSRNLNKVHGGLKLLQSRDTDAKQQIWRIRPAPNL